MTLIVPAILDKTESDFKNHVDQLNNSQNFQEGWVHIDFADNTLVPNETITPETVESNPLKLKKEAHLMVDHPLLWINKLNKAGFDRVIFHLESKDNPEEVIKQIQGAGMDVGIAINPDTPIENLEPFIDTTDQVLIMGITPGFQGQPFIPATIDKIKSLKQKNWAVAISTDGAVRDTNAKSLVEAGVDQLVSGSFLLTGDIDENLEKLWEATNG